MRGDIFQKLTKSFNLAVSGNELYRMVRNTASV